MYWINVAFFNDEIVAEMSDPCDYTLELSKHYSTCVVWSNVFEESLSVTLLIFTFTYYLLYMCVWHGKFYIWKDKLTLSFRPVIVNL